MRRAGNTDGPMRPAIITHMTRLFVTTTSIKGKTLIKTIKMAGSGSLLSWLLSMKYALLAPQLRDNKETAVDAMIIGGKWPVQRLIVICWTAWVGVFHIAIMYFEY